MSPSSILYYISSHGFGHATRSIVLMEALKRLKVSCRARTAGSLAWLFEQKGLAFSAADPAPDAGMVQFNALDVDLGKTLEHHEALGADWRRRVEEEASCIKASGAKLVVADIAPLAFAASRRAGVACVAVSNFSWDWIFSQYAAAQPRFAAVAQRYGEAYASAAAAFRLPMSCPMPAFPSMTDAPLLVRRCALERTAARRALGVEVYDERPLVLVSFGGVKGLKTDMIRSEDLSDFLCAGFGPRPRGLKTDWIEIPVRSQTEHVAVMAACDAVIGKPGYGTFSEALALRKPLLYVPRDFPEAPFLAAEICRLGRAAELPRADFESGRWRAALEGLLESSGAWADFSLDGDEFIALRLAEMVK